MRRRLAEIDDPVVVGARQRIGDVRIAHQKEPFGEPGRIQQRLVDPHRVHVGEAGLRVRGALGRSDAGCAGPTRRSHPSSCRAATAHVAADWGCSVSRKTSPLTFRYAPVRPSWRHSACLPSVRYSGSRYFSHSAGGSTTWLVAVEYREILCRHPSLLPVSLHRSRATKQSRISEAPSLEIASRRSQ